MNTFVVNCSCGHDLFLEAYDREDAIDEMKTIMSLSGISEHFRNYHREGEVVPSVADVHTRIERNIKEMMAV